MDFIRVLIAHGVPSIIGWTRMAMKSPVLAVRLLALRLGFLFTRRLLFTFRDQNGFLITSHYELISYWDFFVERALQDDAWVSEFRSEPHPVAVDVGANAGLFSYLLTTLNPRVEIYAFEPLPALEENIRKIQGLSSNALHFFSAACGREPGRSALCADDRGDTDAQLGVVTTGTKKLSFEVQVLAVDDVVDADQVFLMKIDTQGYEIPVLEGARQTLSRTRHVIVEVGDSSALSQIQNILGPAWKARMLTTCDYLFSRTPQSPKTNEAGIAAP